MADPRHWSITAARDLTHSAGAAAVVDALLARRAEADTPEAWISVPSEVELMQRADEIDQSLAAGADLPLAGVPFAVKDNIDVAGVPTTAGCPAYAYVPARSAPAVERLLAAGAIYAGKTNLDQFATGLVGTRSPHYGPCRNPFAPELIAGGSSSGSAVVVATGQVPIALGTDTAGSGRVPAALCGIVGMKPTPGAVSTVGVVPAMVSFDVVSTFATTVADAVTTFDLLDEEPAGASRVPAAMPRRVGVPDQFDWFGDDDARAQFELAIERTRSLGCTVVEVDGEALRAAGALLYGSALVAERNAAFGEFVTEHPDAVDAAVRTISARGRRAHRSRRRAGVRRTACPSHQGRRPVAVGRRAPHADRRQGPQHRRVSRGPVRSECRARARHRVREPPRHGSGRGAERCAARRVCRSACRWWDRREAITHCWRSRQRSPGRVTRRRHRHRSLREGVESRSSAHISPANRCTASSPTSTRCS